MLKNKKLDKQIKDVQRELNALDKEFYEKETKVKEARSELYTVRTMRDKVRAQLGRLKDEKYAIKVTPEQKERYDKELASDNWKKYIK